VQARNPSILLPWQGVVFPPENATEFVVRVEGVPPPKSSKKTNALPNAGESHTAEQQTPRQLTTARSRYFALVFCGDTGLERGAKPDQDLSPTRSVWRFHVPRIWIRSIGPGEVCVKRKSQNLVRKFLWCLYLVVDFLEERNPRLMQSEGSGTEVL
jgi:hypothetical protein